MSYSPSDREDLAMVAERRRQEKEVKRAKILKLHADGLSVNIIRQRLGMDHHTVRKVIASAGGVGRKACEADNYNFGDAT